MGQLTCPPESCKEVLDFAVATEVELPWRSDSLSFERSCCCPRSLFLSLKVLIGSSVGRPLACGEEAPGIALLWRRITVSSSLSDHWVILLIGVADVADPHLGRVSESCTITPPTDVFPLTMLGYFAGGVPTSMIPPTEAFCTCSRHFSSSTSGIEDSSLSI